VNYLSALSISTLDCYPQATFKNVFVFKRSFAISTSNLWKGNTLSANKGKLRSN